jgi:hypothetical protein
MKIELISNWRDGWRFYANWMYLAIIAAPELYLALSTVPGTDPLILRAVQVMAAIGIIVRFIKQNRPSEPVVSSKR